VFLISHLNQLVKIGLILIVVSLVSLGLTGCAVENNQAVLGNPTPKDFLKNEDSDIFVLENIVYSNAQDLEWVKDLDYTLGVQVGEITKVSKKATGFSNGTSNKLPVGTIIYRTNTPAFIAVVNGKEIPYLMMLEG